MSALATDESASKPLPASQQPAHEVATKHPSATVTTTDEEPPQITVQISVKDPEIVLLADARDKDTNALFLKVSEYHSATACLAKDSRLPFTSAFMPKETNEGTNKQNKLRNKK